MLSPQLSTGGGGGGTLAQKLHEPIYIYTHVNTNHITTDAEQHHDAAEEEHIIPHINLTSYHRRQKDDHCQPKVNKDGLG